MAARIVRPVNKHVVDQHHGAPVDVEADPRLVHLGRLGLQTDVVAVEGDVEHAHRHRGAFDALDLCGETPSEVVAAVGDTHQRDVAGALVTFDDLVGDAGEGTPDVVGVEQRAAHEARTRPAERSREMATPPRACEEARMGRASFSLPSRPRGTGLKGEELLLARIAGGVHWTVESRTGYTTPSRAVPDRKMEQQA